MARNLRRIVTPPAPETPEQELERLRAENAALKSSASAPLRFKVSDKGAVSVYGINVRFPVTLYGDQWRRLLDAAPALLAFIEEHQDELSTKTAARLGL